MTVHPVHEVRASLATPAADRVDIVASLREDAAAVLGALDGWVEFLLGFSPLTEWVTTPLSGDWDALDRGGQAWADLGRAIAASGQNFAALPDQIGRRWDGGATSAAFRAEVVEIGQTFRRCGDGCRSLSELCVAMVQIAQGAAEVIGTVIDIMSELVSRVVEWTTAPAHDPDEAADHVSHIAAQITRWCTVVAEALTRLYLAAEQFAEGFTALRALREAMASLAAAVAAGATASKQGGQVLTRTEAAFV